MKIKDAINIGMHQILLHVFLQLCFTVSNNSPGASDWALMEKCIERMKPLATAIELVESDAATIHTVHRYKGGINM